jgi:hypothetical protein
MKMLPRKRHDLLRPLAAALVAIFGLAPLDSIAAPAVINCNDAGDGSLRQSVLGASDPDTIDLTKLNCTTITLTTGAIFISQLDLTITGPGSDKLTIDGLQNAGDYNILFQAGQGNLKISGLAIRHGRMYLNNPHKYVGGGCIFSSGNVSLDHSIVSDCKMFTGPDAPARGGAVAAENIDLTDTVISGNRVYQGSTSGAGRGGGLYAKNMIHMLRSTLTDNAAPSFSDTMPPNLIGGGLYAKGRVIVEYSTISGNAAAGAAALLCGQKLDIEESTISGNRGYSQAAIVATSPVDDTFIYDSTISGNTTIAPGLAIDTTPALSLAGPSSLWSSTVAFNIGQGVKAAVSSYGNDPLKLYSSIVADNFPADVFVDPNSTSYLKGTNNLIVTASSVALPAGTITSCPKLERLANNGGSTFTHKLQHTSPAVDAGTYLFLDGYDQRGTGYPRVFASKADIGAFEWSGGSDDEVFHSGFDFTSGFCELR